MTNMIDVNSLWNCETCFHHKNGKCDTWCESGESYRPAYSKLKVVEAVEVVHGYWEAYPTRNYKRCSVCKTEYYKLYNGFNGNYCPNCGAKMDGKKVE